MTDDFEDYKAMKNAFKEQFKRRIDIEGKDPLSLQFLFGWTWASMINAGDVSA